MKLRHGMVLVLPLLLVACHGSNQGLSAASKISPSAPSAPSTPSTNHPVASAQPVAAVTTKGAPVTAGLVALPILSGNENLQFVVTHAPAHGKVSLSNATFTYTPATGYVGGDSFGYAVHADTGTSTPATVTVNVLSTAPPPPPSLATACSGLGSAMAPVCSLLGTVATPLVTGCSSLAPADFCSAFGGNLYGLAAGCFTSLGGQSAQAADLCKAVGTALQGVASLCRSLNLPTDTCALFSGQAIAEREIKAYLQGALHRALQLQWQLGSTLPLGKALVPATHNSFNFTNANFPPTVSGLDPDQFYSMTQQLDMDMHGLELDVHWFPSLSGGGFAPILCHGETNHIGCTTERPLATGLSALRKWLDAHPKQVIFLDVEQHLDDSIDDASKSFPAAAAAFERTLGKQSKKDLIFRPGELLGTAGSCKQHDIPLNVSPAQILATGKQVLVYSSGCGHDAGWDAIIFDESNRLQGPKTDFGGDHYPQCHFTRAQYQQHWTRFYDSSTLTDALTGSGTAQPMTPSQVRQMVRCGVNMPSVNFLTPHSLQLRSFVWSWAYGQPVASTAQNCAVQNAQGFFQAESCQQRLPYACKGSAGWHVTTTSGLFSDGQAACAAQFPGSHFAVPRSGYQDELLKTAKATAGVNRLWLNYSRNSAANTWRAGD